ncbi:FadR/GntR family transcriptional regulator [Clostridium magnum]|uniref:HTH-type transcriptional regulator LutR n=1 Tax=Clostridium magnum DSM 2767 TaxID=1121326 RepID=A0A161X6X3_9CLOT|nr:FadR/GntR family transcriptional regulator [Clostridium magnum]KZL89836.1 HTH-type transcriptional regulator LutR [Clostridium magnum DSM 2767]SHI70128.1 GntR family transcriptional regulator, transcriptional repressor for pyruvate dehydrogenase complex [Clostridium magnum DSM 2767]
MKLPKISRTTLVDKVVEIIIEKIKSGEFKPGEKLPGEIELSTQLGISRPTIREAISYLVGLGIIKRGDLGIQVAGEPTSMMEAQLSSLILVGLETKKLYEARRILEVEIADLAAQRATSEDIEELVRLNERVMEKLYDKEEYWNVECEFHLGVARIADNEVLYLIYKVILDLYKKIEREIFEQKRIIEITPINHEKLIEAIKNGDSSKARNVVDASIINAEEEMLSIRFNEKLNN